MGFIKFHFKVESARRRLPNSAPNTAKTVAFIVFIKRGYPNSYPLKMYAAQLVIIRFQFLCVTQLNLSSQSLYCCDLINSMGMPFGVW